MSYVNLVADLADARFSQRSVHHALEALDARALRPVREHRTPERILSWIDATFGGVWSSEAALGAAWIIEGARGPLGFAAYAPRGLRYHWLRSWEAQDDVGILGPIGVAPRAQRAGMGRVLLHAALFALRERGYRRALIPAVHDRELIGFYERNAGARVVERVDPMRGGRRWRTTVLASGNGTNFEAVLDAAARGAVPLDVNALVANKASAFALERATRANVATEVVVWDRAHEAREAYDARIAAAVAAHEPDLVLLLGWMHVLSAPFIARFPQMLNLHPAYLPLTDGEDVVTMPDGSRLPAFRGAHAIDDALASGLGWAGVSVHRVTPVVDRGAVLARMPLELRAAESRAALDERLHALERRVVATAIKRWSWEQP